MKWTSERINTFKADSFNQLAIQHPLIFILLCAALVVAGMVLIQDLGNEWNRVLISKYVCGIMRGVGALVGIRLRWNSFEKKEPAQP